MDNLVDLHLRVEVAVVHLDLEVKETLEVFLHQKEMTVALVNQHPQLDVVVVVVELAKQVKMPDQVIVETVEMEQQIVLMDLQQLELAEAAVEADLAVLQVEAEAEAADLVLTVGEVAHQQTLAEAAEADITEADQVVLE